MASTLRSLVKLDRPLVTPLAHDALTARMIQRAGFQAMGIGGSSMLAARYGLPDIGLAALGEMAAGIADVVAATDLPVMVDGDDGYGDVKAVARMVEVFMRLGVSGIVLEDQMRGEKQPGDAGAIGVVDTATMVDKVRVAVSTCAGTELTIVARCDAYKLEGLDGAMRRAEAYFAAGAHALFVPGMQDRADFATLGARFRGAHLVAGAFEGRETWLHPDEFFAMGFRQIVFPTLLMTRVARALDTALADFRRHVDGVAPMPALEGFADAQEALRQAVQFDKWAAIK